MSARREVTTTMVPEIITIILFFVVIAITAVVFFGWIAFVVLRLLFEGIAALFAPSSRAHAMHPRQVPVANPRQAVRCATEGCHTLNPGDARFCRRCGRGLPAGAAERVHVRRAAVW